MIQAPPPSLQSLLEQSGDAYRTFKPRPDQPDRFDQQESFVRSQTYGVKGLVGGNGAGTTECMVHAASRFILSYQPPPRYDTPFWVVAGTYEQVCETLWKEKFYGKGHIPKCEIDWERISWYKSNQNWPLRVPLKPWPNRPGKNWVLEFKSYKQGRANMQARSIGGFAISEQFPYEILQEILRGCREYSFGGSKMFEFTPIDPGMSQEIQEMMENGTEPEDYHDRNPGALYLPKSWEIYRANTLCALEAEHVKKEWFDQFYSMIPDEMRETRLTGAWGSFEGVIYPTFNPAVHVIEDAEAADIVSQPGMERRRGIDWGFGAENAFACVWGARDGMGNWTIYREYYSNDQLCSPTDHIQNVMDLELWPKMDASYGMTWCDPSNVGAKREAARMGMMIAGGRNSVYDGIACVQNLLKVPTPRFEGDRPIPRLRIARSCRNLIKQLQTYRWMKGTEGVNAADAKPLPVKKDDHACDSLRYLLYSEQSYVPEAPSMPKIPPSGVYNGNGHSRFGVQLNRR